MGVLQSSLLQGLLLHLMLLVIHVQIRHPSKDLACHPGLVLPLKIVIVHSDASSNLAHCSRLSRSAITNHSFLAPDIETMGDSVQGSPLLLNKWESPSRVSPSPQQMVSLLGGPLLQVNGIHLKGFPLSTANGIRFKGAPFSKVNGIHLKRFPLSTANGICFKGSPSPKRMGFASRGSLSPKRMGFASRGSPSPQRMGFASRESPSPKRMGFASRGSPYPMRMRVASRGSPSPMRMGFASRGSPSPKRMGFASRDSSSPQRQCFASRDPASPRHQHSSRASSGDNPFERPHSRSSPTNPSSPSKGDKEADESSLTAPVKAMIDFILKSFPDAQESPYHPSSRSFDLSAYAGVTDAAIPSGSLLA